MFTISPDGTLVTSYYLVGVTGNTCSFYSNAETPEWPGVPLEQNAFDFEETGSVAISLKGSFPGAQSASGTFSLHQNPTAGTAACDTGTVSWTATTTSMPASAGTGGPGSGGPGSGPAGSGHKPTFVTRLRLRRVSRTRLGGRVSSPNRSCRARRKVFLWRGSRRIASTKSKANGDFTFPRSVAVRSRRVRVSSPWLTIGAGTCAAGSSTFMTA